MKTFEIVVHNPTGLHARPAKILVNTAKTFKSAVRIGHGAKQANAKSLISVLTLGVESGGVVRLEVEGEDEDVAALARQTIIEQGLGEGTGEPVTVPVPEVQKLAAVTPAPAAAAVLPLTSP